MRENMAIRVLVNGALGRMGQEVVQALKGNAQFDVVGTCGRGDDLSTAIQHSQADVVVDFTNANAVFDNAQKILAAGARPMIGTSGLMPEQIQQLKDRAKAQKLGGIIAPNCSLGAVLMMKYATQWIKYFPQAEIVELHHNGKLDAPSGTALRTAQVMSTLRGKQPESPPERVLVAGARGADVEGIHVHSVRLPGLVAHQEIIFGGVDETLIVRHDSIHRRCFMPGVLLACEKVMGLKELVYGLENIID
jgi:4-hydroxy-tetrahydrodipicolinate reductase